MRDQRRSLHDFVECITACAWDDAPNRRRLEPMARAVLEALRIDPITAGLRLNLAAGILGAEGFEQELEELVDRAHLRFRQSSRKQPRPSNKSVKRLHRSKLSPLEDRLASSDDPHQRLLAFVALVAQSHDSNRWNDARRDRLTSYRKDPAPLVAIRAQYFFDADEA